MGQAFNNHYEETEYLAEAAVQSRDEVLGTIAHDLRNPLAAIDTTVRLLLRGDIPLEQYPTTSRRCSTTPRGMPGRSGHTRFRAQRRSCGSGRDPCFS